MESQLSIPQGKKYQGYYWLSNSDKPVVVDGNFDGLSLPSEENPFIVEAQLYSAELNKSYSIKYIDGRYIVIAFDVNDEDETLVYKASWDIKKELIFKCCWRPESDPLCEGMDVLKPSEYYFVGFNN